MQGILGKGTVTHSLRTVGGGGESFVIVVQHQPLHWLTHG